MDEKAQANGINETAETAASAQTDAEKQIVSGGDLSPDELMEAAALKIQELTEANNALAAKLTEAENTLSQARKLPQFSAPNETSDSYLDGIKELFRRRSTR